MSDILKITAGPWHSADTDHLDVYGANGEMVAHVHGPIDFPCFDPETDEEYTAALEEGEANHRLVLTAPDLFEVLEAQEALRIHVHECEDCADGEACEVYGEMSGLVFYLTMHVFAKITSGVDFPTDYRESIAKQREAITKAQNWDTVPMEES